MIDNNNYIKFNKLLKDNNIIHIFTKRPFNFSNITNSEYNIEKEYKEIEQILDYKFKKIKKPIQNHTNNIKILTKDNINDDFINIDGIITNLPGVALVTQVADCQAILLYDPINKVIGNVHSGWRGTLNKIIKNAINIMVDNYNCTTENIEAYICPSILKCCFEVEKDVVNLFKNNYKNIDEDIYLGKVIDNKQKYYIDTVNINIKLMKELGIKENNITCSNICTKCNSNKYHSYRVDKDKSGRNIALICLK